MLVLSRKSGEAIVICNDIKIEVVEICQGKVRLGISAPVNIPIHRKENFDKIQAEADSLDHAPDGTIFRGYETGRHPLAGLR